jgi:ketosteroid isomerase-like protein
MRQVVRDHLDPRPSPPPLRHEAVVVAAGPREMGLAIQSVSDNFGHKSVLLGELMTDEKDRNKALALQFMDANNRNDASALTNMYAEDGTHQVMGTTPISGVYTKQQMLAAAGAIYAPFPDGKPLTVIGIVAEGDTVTVEVDSPARHESGAMYHQFIHWVLRFRDGLLVQTKEYLDTALVIEVLCGGGAVTPASPESTPSMPAV